MTTSSRAIRTTAGFAALLGATLLGSVLVAAPAAAEPPPSHGPNGHASCVGQIFVPQATGEPGQVARRIAEIKDHHLEPGENFGSRSAASLRAGRSVARASSTPASAPVG